MINMVKILNLLGIVFGQGRTSCVEFKDDLATNGDPLERYCASVIKKYL